MLTWLRRAGFTALIAAGVVGLAATIAVATGAVRFVAIQSNSMQPDWARGSLVVLASEPVSDVRAGQVVAYQPPPDLFPHLLVHEVVSVRHVGSQSAVIVTRGIANKVDDPWRARLQHRAWHVVGSVPWLGFIPMALSRV